MNPINRFFHLRMKKFRILNKISFLKRCRDHKVIPKFVRVYYNQVNSFRIKKNLFQCSLAIVRSTIKDHRFHLAKIEEELYFLHHKLARSCDDFSLIDARSYQRAVHVAELHQQVLSRKFDALLPRPPQDCFRKFSSFSNSPKIVNLSSTTLSDSQSKVLEYGLNHAFPQNKMCPTHLLAPIERCLLNSKISADQKDSLRHLIRSTVLSNQRSHPAPLNRSELSAIRELKDNKDIVITPADKGGQVVIMDTCVYHDNVENLLQDGPYERLHKDPAPSFLKVVQKKISKSNFLLPSTKKRIFPSAAFCGRFYALPKVHKSKFSMRPIVSCIGTPTYKLAKLLVEILSPLCSSNRFSVKNSSEFVSIIRGINPENSTMVSFDVKSMFTNIPITGSLNYLRQRLFEFHFSAFEVDQICDLTDLCISHNYFVVFEKFYRQKDGLSMGNPLSPILCDIYMDFFESRLLDICPFKLWVRYVDDTFTLWEGNSEELNDTLELMNSLDSNIQFTYEIETNNHLPFLDVSVVKTSSGFRTSVYRKPFAVCLPPHATSSHPPSQKFSAFFSFVRRAINICSDQSSLQNELNILRDIACDRGFSPFVIDKIFQKISRKPISSLIPFSKDPPNNFIVLPFAPATSFRISSILKKFSFNVIFRPVRSVRYSHVKDPIPPSRLSGVYFVACSQCNRGYIGQTRRNLETRISEHKKSVQRGEISKSAIAKHCWDSNHLFDFDNAFVFRRPAHNLDLDFLEGFFIRCCDQFLVNDGRNTPSIANVYNAFVHSQRDFVLKSLHQRATQFSTSP